MGKRPRGRLDTLTVSSPALGRRALVWVLKPRGWTAGSTGWPVLYLLHPCCGPENGWLVNGGVERLTARLKAVVIMPEADRMGWYSDWKDGPAWETFHLTELRGLLEPRYGATGRRAVAGASMGGFGAMSYAARHPGLFAAAASFSGVLDTTLDRAGFGEFLSAGGADPDRLWGDDWAAHNPKDLAARLKGVALFVSGGDGRPGPLDRKGASSRGDAEAAVTAQSRSFARAAASAGARLRTDFYGRGRHTWPYWSRGLARALPILFPGAVRTGPR
ncbi:alpha/beta hydrolase family protein [Actinocorallia longicatena]|uniref:Alpha/beta hydrolase family protein n=1 Tax=Actinocorallia longicatena TaxID=111803 RepID=A0ABP6QCH9_9ACTN